MSAALGLGEGVVAGTAHTDRFVLAPNTGKVLSSNIVLKRRKVVSVDKGGVRTAAVDGVEGKRPSLTRAQLRSLAARGRKLEDIFGGPQDIEFAVAGKAVQILQSRPMTALQGEVEPDEPWDKTVDKRYTWQRHSARS